MQFRTNAGIIRARPNETATLWEFCWEAFADAARGAVEFPVLSLLT